MRFRFVEGYGRSMAEFFDELTVQVIEQKEETAPLPSEEATQRFLLLEELKDHLLILQDKWIFQISLK